MNSTTNSLFITATSTPTTTSVPAQSTVPTPAPTQLPSQPSTGFAWVSILLPATGIGFILAAWIKRGGDSLLKEKDIQIASESRKHAKELDEVRRSHEERMQHLKDEYEDDRQRRVEKFRLIDDWRRALGDESTATAELMKKYNSTLKKHFSDEANRRVSKAIGGNAEHLFQLQMSIIEEGFEFKKEEERLYRLNCVRGDLVKALDQEITNLEIEMKRY